MSDRRNYRLIPPLIRESLVDYGLNGQEVGGFLQAVLANDFMDAIARADADSIRGIEAIRQFVYQELPAISHGSRRVYQAWVHLHCARRDGTLEQVHAAQDILTAANAAAADWRSGG